MSFLFLIIVLVICILGEGFFSGSEMAVVNADRLKIRTASKKGSRFAKAVESLTANPAKFFSITLLGTNICTVTASVVTTLYIIDHYGPDYTGFALLIFPFTLIVGELIPKSLYQYYANQLVFVVSPILLTISTIFSPVVWVLAKFTDALLSRVKREESEVSVSREALEAMLEASEKETTDVKEVERTLISRIFDLAETRVGNIKTPLVDVAALPASAPREEAIAFIEEKGFTKVPVYSGKFFNILGVLHNTDFLFEDASKSVRELMHPPYYVPEEMSLDELFISMKKKGELIAIVVDEYGAATGIVTIEDVMEEVVGEIRDEHDVVPTHYRRLGHRNFLVNGRMELKEANERLKLGIVEGEYETIAGYVVYLAKKIPALGDIIESDTLRFIVRKATDRAVLEVEILGKEPSK
ncbi:MAG: hypothetical protein A3I05_02070 [Deltaproteobacteria bacterium RIFCSPLOWO2_02_FULL_44_10]|nr:MAG: hypothetical protein A3I05_02070 [Deltaproteobacteria bacterium RIFCSPLOWO2_02_FULL_44_10]